MNTMTMNGTRKQSVLPRGKANIIIANGAPKVQKDSKMDVDVNGYKISMSHQLITPEDAQAMLDLYDYDGQRPLRQGNLDFLIDEMSRGRFAPFTVLTLCITDSGTFLTDGRHRLLAIVSSGQSQWFWVQEIKGDIDPADVFVVQDINAPRTQMNLLKALGTMDSVAVPVLSKGPMTAAAKHLAYGPNTHVKIHARDLHTLLTEWLPYFSQYGAAITGGDCSQQMRSSPFAASGALTFKHCPDKARDFWHGMSFDDGLARYDPRKRGVNMLRDSESIFRVAGGQATVKSFRILAYLWNKYIAGEEIKHLPQQFPEKFTFNGTGWGLDGAGLASNKKPQRT